MLSRLFKRERQGSPFLTREGRLVTDLWLDQPDAERQIAARLARGDLTAEQAEKLRHFAERGYLTLAPAVPESVFADLEAAVERLWKEKPFEVAYSYHSPLKPFAYSDEARERKPSYRIADLHSYAEGALDLYLHPEIHAYVDLVWGQKSVATQSLLFEYGSQQALHRDPVHVHMYPASHLAAAWVALEDIGPDCGPLTYVPGSHRLPYFQFQPGEYRLHHGQHGPEDVARALEFDLAQCRQAGLRPETFTCKRGEVLIWHHSLLHGGSPPNDPALTRKSFVVHFSTLANYKRLRQTIVEYVPDREGKLVERVRTFGTDKLLVRDGCHGFDNPLRGYRGPAREPAS